MLARNRVIVQILCVGRTLQDRPLHLWTCNPIARPGLGNYPRINGMHRSSSTREGNSFPYPPPDYP